MCRRYSIKGSGLRLAVDPLGGAGVAYWPRIEERYGIGLQVLRADVDQTFRFMSLDWDGRIRMDCSSPYAMAGLIARIRDGQFASGTVLFWHTGGQVGLFA